MKANHLFVSLLVILGMVGCKHNSSSKPRPDRFTLDNVERLVMEDILGAEKLDGSVKEYQYSAGASDLNGDGSEEIFVLMQDTYFCGSGGCTGFLFSDKGELISRMSVTREPVLVANRKTNGWNDLYVWSNGSLRVMSFDGKSYPANPSTEREYNRDRERDTARQTLEVQEVYVQDGYDLKEITELPIFSPAHVYQFSFKHHGDPQHLYMYVIDMVTGRSELELLPIVKENEK